MIRGDREEGGAEREREGKVGQTEGEEDILWLLFGMIILILILCDNHYISIEGMDIL